MATVILDFGSANTHKNNWNYLKRMIDELKAVDTGKHEVIIKHQLFKEAGANIPLDHDLFRRAYDYADLLGYRTTSSVFDEDSLDFLLQFDVPMVKIANRRDLDYLIGEVPRRIPVYVSFGNADTSYLKQILYQGNIYSLLCVSQYPATMEDYEETFNNLLRNTSEYKYGISDHTTNFGLWYRYQPQIVEWHYVLEHDPGNLDGGSFARTPEQLREVL